MGDQKNLILAIVMSVAIILLFQMVIAPPTKTPPPPGQPATTQPASPGTVPAPPGAAPPTVPGQPAAPGTVPAAPPKQATRADVLKANPRVAIDAKRVTGSISLKGGQLDDVTLRDYRETIKKDSANVHLLNPAMMGKGKAYYVLFGWSAVPGQTLDLPGDETPWTASGGPLAPGKPVTLTWTSTDGLKFTRRFEIDDNYLITVVDKVENGGAKPVQLAPYAVARLIGEPKTLGFFILHEGPVAAFRFGGNSAEIEEISYKTVREKGVFPAENHPREAADKQKKTTGGWLGFTDHYWLVALIPNQQEIHTPAFRYSSASDTYTADYLGKTTNVAPGAAVETTHRVFAGAKEVKVLRAYEERLALPKFDDAIDFGWFFFFTRPFLNLLIWLNGLVGNFGIAILILTIGVKILFFPLANKSYKSMSQMKKLSPEIQRVRERYAQDKAMLNQELMKLYKKERINPAAGCLPIVVQIPVFFALYKVLFVAIEMRHAPFFGWIQDLSNKDPTSVLNLFGLLPWAVPGEGSLFDMANIGIWPLIMGGTMWLQHKLNPAPPDPIQAKVFAWMPVIFTVMLANFPAGLVIYWAWNNVLSIGQQWLIMKKTGAIGVHHPASTVPRNIKELEARKAAKAAAAADAKEKAAE